MDTVTEEVWEFASKATIIPFSIFMSLFHQRFTEQISCIMFGITAAVLPSNQINCT
jgi:hypothetical protein